jgi:hypothetical protein
MAVMASVREYLFDLAKHEEQDDQRLAGTGESFCGEPIFRLLVPGHAPVTGTREDVLRFSRLAFPRLVGRGLVARVWSGQREGACQIFTIAPRRLAL